MSGEIIAVGPKLMWEEKSSSFEVVYNRNYVVDVSVTAIVVTLPDGGVLLPSIGDSFTIDDYKGNSSVNNITIQAHANDGGSGNLIIEGVSGQDVIIDVDGSRVTLTYVDGTYGWRYKVI